MQTGPRSAAPPSKPVPRPRADHTQQPKHQPGLRTSGLRPFTVPATKVSDAKERVVKLERALAAMEGIDGSEVDAIREALERAKKAAQSPPVETQIRDCEQFLIRARAHLEAIDAQRATVVASIEEGSKRLESLKVVQQTQPPQTHFQARSIARRFRAFVCRGDAAMGVGPSTRPPVSDHGRQARGGREDLPVDHPRRPRVARSSSRTNHGRTLHVAFHGGSDGSMSGQQLGDVDRDALHGLRGVRVGEASHPGPRRRRRVRSSSVESSWSGPDRTLLDDCERLLASGLERTVGTQIDVSSDDEPLLRPRSGRHVVPRMGERDHGEEGVGFRGLPGPGCRRGLVVEVAPGVVDASAVALPSSHVIPNVAESDAPVFHWDPDEDDDVDALSRNATDALGGHAYLQRPTQVDRDDEVTVSVGRVTPWLHADGVAGTGIDSQASGDRGARAFPANRFFSLTDNSEVDGQVAPTSDTDSLGPPRNRRRRLRLNWNSQGSNDRLGPVHQPRHQQVRAAEVLFHELARRVGAVPVGSPVPRIVLQQRWSPVNVPLMWAAAGSESSTPVLEFLCEITTGVPDIHFNEGTLSTNVAVRTGWQALREAMRSWGVGQEVYLQAWL